MMLVNIALRFVPPEKGMSRLFTCMASRRVVLTAGCCLVLYIYVLHEILFLEYQPLYLTIMVTQSLTGLRMSKGSKQSEFSAKSRSKKDTLW